MRGRSKGRNQDFLEGFDRHTWMDRGAIAEREDDIPEEVEGPGGREWKSSVSLGIGILLP